MYTATRRADECSGTQVMDAAEGGRAWRIVTVTGDEENGVEGAMQVQGDHMNNCACMSRHCERMSRQREQTASDASGAKTQAAKNDATTRERR